MRWPRWRRRWRTARAEAPGRSLVAGRAPSRWRRHGWSGGSCWLGPQGSVRALPSTGPPVRAPRSTGPPVRASPSTESSVSHALCPGSLVESYTCSRTCRWSRVTRGPSWRARRWRRCARPLRCGRRRTRWSCRRSPRWRWCAGRRPRPRRRRAAEAGRRARCRWTWTWWTGARRRRCRWRCGCRRWWRGTGSSWRWSWWSAVRRRSRRCGRVGSTCCGRVGSPMRCGG